MGGFEGPGGIVGSLSRGFRISSTPQGMDEAGWAIETDVEVPDMTMMESSEVAAKLEVGAERY